MNIEKQRIHFFLKTIDLFLNYILRLFTWQWSTFVFFTVMQIWADPPYTQNMQAA